MTITLAQYMQLVDANQTSIVLFNDAQDRRGVHTQYGSGHIYAVREQQGLIDIDTDGNLVNVRRRGCLF
jgi:hypothetical protein